MRFLFYFLAIFIITLSACDGSDGCNNEPRPDRNENPNFLILQGGVHNDGKICYPQPNSSNECVYKLRDKDTCVVNAMSSYIGFKASNYSDDEFSGVQYYDSVKWKVGDEASFRNGEYCVVDFIGIEGELEVVMYGFVTIEYACNKKIRYVDTCRKLVNIVPFEQSKLFGVWKGAYSGKSDSTLIEFKRNDLKGFYAIQGFPETSLTSFNQTYRMYYDWFIYASNLQPNLSLVHAGDTSFYLGSIYGRIIDNNTLMITVDTYTDDVNNPKTLTYLARKE